MEKKNWLKNRPRMEVRRDAGAVNHLDVLSPEIESKDFNHVGILDQLVSPTTSSKNKPKQRVRRELMVEQAECIREEQTTYMGSLPDSPSKLSPERGNSTQDKRLSEKAESPKRWNSIFTFPQESNNNGASSQGRERSNNWQLDAQENFQDPTYAIDERVEVDYSERSELLNNSEKEAASTCLRAELQSYLNELQTKTDEAGSPLVEFPGNYDSVVSLMTLKDISKSAKEKTWFTTLIASDLLRSKALGVSPDEEDEMDPMEIKIAKGLAKIQKLDLVLEKKSKASFQDTSTKLGRSIFLTQIQTKPEQTGPTPMIGTPMTHPRTPKSPRAPSRSNLQSARSLNISTKDKSSIDFVQRNREIAESADVTLTKEELARLHRLLGDDDEVSSDLDKEPKLDESFSGAYQVDANEQNRLREIESKLKDASGHRTEALSSILMDEFTEDIEEIEKQASENVIQENRRDRVISNRMSVINEALEYLRHAPVNELDTNSGSHSPVKSIYSASTALSSVSFSPITRVELSRITDLAKKSAVEHGLADRNEIKKLLTSMQSNLHELAESRKYQRSGPPGFPTQPLHLHGRLLPAISEDALEATTKKDDGATNTTTTTTNSTTTTATTSSTTPMKSSQPSREEGNVGEKTERGEGEGQESSGPLILHLAQATKAQLDQATRPAIGSKATSAGRGEAAPSITSSAHSHLFSNPFTHLSSSNQLPFKRKQDIHKKRK